MAPVGERPPSWQGAGAGRARTAALAVLALGLLAVLAANLPGQMSYDSVVQLEDGRSGVYHAWHPAVMAWLLGLGDAVLPGTAVYMAVVAALGFAALALPVLDAPRAGWAAPVAALALCASPLLLLEQGIVWKDVLFADSFVAGFTLLASAARPGRSAFGRWLRAALAAAALILAVLVRQNGLVMAVFGAVAAGWTAWSATPPNGSTQRRGRALLAAAALLLVVLAGAAAANAALSTRRPPDDVGPAGQLRLLKLYDLVGIARRAPDVDLSAVRASGLEAHLRAAVHDYSPLKNDTIALEPGIEAATSEGDPGLDAAWRGAVLHHPGAWLAHRLDVFRWIYLPPDVTRCAAVYTGVDGPPDELADLGLKSAWRGQDLKLARYARAFTGTPVYSHAAWSALAVVLAAALLWRRRPADGVMAAMLGSGLAYAASFFVIGIACDHRYLYPLDLATMAALLHLACDPSGFRRRTGASDPSGLRRARAAGPTGPRRARGR